MTPDLSFIPQMREAAKAATPGIWFMYGRFVQAVGSVDTWSGPVWGTIFSAKETYDTDGEGRNWSTSGSPEANARFIALANPSNVITLLDALEAAQAENAKLREALKPFETFAENVDDNGWTSNVHREAVSNWFGPSDFLQVRAAFQLEPSEEPAK